ncbi:MAG: SMC-Scp complex subunit ScpB [Promethearchaeota archaeon]|jgi:segregation and condensation protein B
MNNFDENIKEDSKEKLKDEFKENPEGLQDKEDDSNEVMEIKDDSDEVMEMEDDLNEVMEIEDDLDEVMETEDEFNVFPKEIYDIEKPEIENLDSMNEVTEENLESEKGEKEFIERQLRDFHRNLIEASLYAAGRPLNIEEISNKLELPKKEVEELINEVAFEYLDRSTALIIAQIGDRYQMQIRPEYTEKVSKFAKGGAIAERYLRTLTVIALKQPILKSMVIKLRGTGAYEHVKYLVDNGFINAVKKGRSQDLTTTDKYADMFGLPKNKTELKRAMVTQLGISEDEDQIQSNEVEVFKKKEDSFQ